VAVTTHCTKDREEKRPVRFAMANLVRMDEGNRRMLLVIEDLRESEQLRVAAMPSNNGCVSSLRVWTPLSGKWTQRHFNSHSSASERNRCGLPRRTVA